MKEKIHIENPQGKKVTIEFESGQGAADLEELIEGAKSVFVITDILKKKQIEKK